MALSNFARSLILLAALAAFGCSGTTNDNSNEITPTAERPASSIPFGSLEPVQYSRGLRLWRCNRKEIHC